MKNKITKELINEQNEIINSDSKRMIISAGPGSGKTYTIIAKARKELNELEFACINKGVIMCSFTRESSLELKKRLSNELKNDLSFINTLDSFVFQVIINPYRNRILQKIDLNNKKIKGKFKFYKPPMNKNKIVHILTRQGQTENNQNDIVSYYKNWINEFEKGIYELSFPTYLVSYFALKNLNSLVKHIQSRYHSIYIDEAQDLNSFQIKFVEMLIAKTDINCYLIGDKKQSIYGFRGAKPELFSSMNKKGFDEYEITHSARCHYNILEFSKNIVGEGEGKNKLENKGEVCINHSILEDIEYLNKINDFCILVESNKEAKDIYDQCQTKGIKNIIYSKRIELNADKSFSDDYYEIVEELLKFFFNHKNPIAKLTYSIESLINFLEPFISIKKLNIKNLSLDINFVSYLKKIFLLGEIEIPENIINEIEEKISNDICRNHYIRYSNKNRIMTVHSSKGLEFEKVFLHFTRKTFSVDEETKRKLFVAFTRSKNNLFIGFNGSEESKLEEYIKKIFKMTFN